MDVREKLSTEKRLIDANKLIKNGIRVSYGFDNDGKLLIPMGDVIRSIKEAPTIDAVPVRHGRWVQQPLNGTHIWRCSKCETLGSPQWNYCPKCGVRMDEEVKNER